eukprot:tig00001278_g7997.t1
MGPVRIEYSEVQGADGDREDAYAVGRSCNWPAPAAPAELDPGAAAPQKTSLSAGWSPGGAGSSSPGTGTLVSPGAHGSWTGSDPLLTSSTGPSTELELRARLAAVAAAADADRDAKPEAAAEAASAGAPAEAVQGSFGAIVGGLVITNNRWTLRFVVKDAPGLDLERHYARCNAARHVVLSRVLAGVAILNCLASALGGSSKPAATFHFAQLLAVPFLAAFFGFTFWRRAFHRLFEPAMCASIAIFSFSQRTLWPILIGHNGPNVLFVTTCLLVWIACSCAGLRFHVSAAMTLYLCLEFVVPPPLFIATRGEVAVVDWSWRCLLGLAMSAAVSLKSAYLADDYERALFAHELRAVAPAAAEAGADADAAAPAEEGPLREAVRALLAAGATFSAPRPPPEEEELRGAESLFGLGRGGPARGGPRAIHPLANAEAEASSPRGRLAAFVFGRRLEPASLHRRYWRLYAKEAWERARGLCLLLTGGYLVSVVLTGLANVIDVDARFARVTVLGASEHILNNKIWLYWIFELGVAGGIFVLGCAVLYVRPRALVAHGTRLVAFALLVAQLACLTTLRTYNNDFATPDYLNDFWPKLSMLSNLYFLAGAFRIPPRTFLLFNTISLLYAAEVFYNPHGMRLLLHYVSFVVAPFVAAACVTGLVERRARRRFLLEHATGEPLPKLKPTDGAAVAPA